MSLIQKIPIKRINKIRKILLLYIDKDLKIQQKNKKHFDCISKQFDDNIFQKMYSTPINIEQYYSNISTQHNDMNTILVGDLSFNDFTYKHYTSDLKVCDSYQSSFNSNRIKGTLSKKTFFQNNASELIINNLLKTKNERKHINKSEKSYIVIKDDKIKIKKTYLIDLSRNLKNIRKRRKCKSSMKIKTKGNESNKNKDKKTILEVKKKKKNPDAEYIKNQKTAYASKRSLSTIDQKDLNMLIKKQKRRSLFFKKK